MAENPTHDSVAPSAEHSASLARQDFSQNPCSFESLKREGITLAQNISGNIWTDYNRSDPGVTLLEILCFGISDGIYRSQFSVEDMLTRENGHIDYQRNGLYSPEQIFPCRATTAEDYRQLVLDQCAGVNNLWINVNPMTGLYDIHLDIADTHCTETCKKSVIDVYHRHRNLCESLGSVSILPRRKCQLTAQVVVNNGVDNAKCLADIYHCVNECISARPATIPYAQADDLSLEALFTGPLTEYARYLPSTNATINIGGQTQDLSAALYFSVNQLAGVDQVNQLSIALDEATAEHNTNPHQTADSAQTIEKNRKGQASVDHTAFNDYASLAHRLTLHMPSSIAEVNVVLLQNNTVLGIDWSQSQRYFEQALFDNYASTHQKQDWQLLYTMPSGKYRKLYTYHSLQSQLPSVYTLGASANTSSETPESQQLRAYLLLFEQLLADFNANLYGISVLFSTDWQQQKSAFSALLKNTDRAGISDLYLDTSASKFEASAQQQQRALAHKSRVVDYLLALYGESIPSDVMGYLDGIITPQAREKSLLSLKLNFLKDVVQLGKNRGAALDYMHCCEAREEVFVEEIITETTSDGSVVEDINLSLDTCRYSKPYPEHLSGFQQRLAYFLGMRRQRWGSLVQGFNAHKISIHDRLHDTGASFPCRSVSVPKVASNVENLQQNASTLLLAAAKRRLSAVELAKQLSPIFSLFDGKLPTALLHHGSNTQRYRVLAREDRQGFELLFKPCSCCDYWVLGQYGKREEALNTVANLQQFIEQRTAESDGFHVVEHALLVDADTVNANGAEARAMCAPVFHQHKMSLFFPNWSLRTRQDDFKTKVRRIVRAHSPAHIKTDCYWLSFDEMRVFERLYQAWLASVSPVLGEQSPNGRSASEALAQWIRTLAQKETCGDGQYSAH